MGSRRSLSAVASFASGALLACLLSGQPAPGQPAPGQPAAGQPAGQPRDAPPPPPHGRYQMELVRHGGNTASTTVFICDTHTGHVWYRETLGGITEWTDMGAPIPGVRGGRPEETLSLNKLPDLPAHWRHVPERGTDTRVGRFVSSENDLVVHYDIGELAGRYASTKAYPNRQWLRSGRLGESAFQYLLNDDGTLYVTFPGEGPANFWAKVGGRDDIDYVLELLARHRQALLRAGDPAKPRQGDKSSGAQTSEENE